MKKESNSEDPMERFAIDSHIHCGVQTVSQSIERILPFLIKAKIYNCCMFAPVEDVYPRRDIDFHDSDKWIKIRKKANQYLRDVSKKTYLEEKVRVIPYTFVWNDFDTQFGDETKGVKWHRHDDEPYYDYKSEKCEKFLQKIYERKLPIVYEEEFEHTLKFIKRLNGRTILIIPHLGMLNGGYERLKKAKVWENPYVFGDTALAGKHQVLDFVKCYGADRLLFGSDWPFGDISNQKRKIVTLNISDEDKDKILYKNIQKLIGVVIKK